MGNSSSCFCPASSCPRTRSAKLLDPHGALQRLDIPVQVAELMVEYPGHLVSSLDRVRQTGRFVALRADDELLAGEFYITVPGIRINCWAREDELAVIWSACKGRPAWETDRGIFHDADVGVEEKDAKKGGSGQQQQLSCHWSHCRQWNPVLEPIFE